MSDSRKETAASTIAQSRTSDALIYSSRQILNFPQTHASAPPNCRHSPYDTHYNPRRFVDWEKRATSRLREHEIRSLDPLSSPNTAKLATGGIVPPLSARTNTEKQTQSSENRNRNEKNGQSSKEGQSDAYELTDFNHPPNHTTADDDFEAREVRRVAKRVEKLARREEQFEMKFSHSIQFNAVPDWSSHYIAYSNLKKLIYQLEKNQNQQNAQTTDAEAAPLLAGNVDPDQIFTRALDVELEKLSSFYQIKELEIFSEISELLSQQEEYDAEMQENGMEGSSDVHDGHARRPSSFYRGNTVRNARPLSAATRSMTDDVDDSDEDDDEETALHRKKPEVRRSMTAPSDVDGSHGAEDMWNSTAELNRRSSVAAYDDYANEAFSLYYSSGISLKKNTVSVYVQLCELKSFIQLNQTGFRKVLKKYDKILDRNLREKYMSQTVAPSYVFRPSTIKHVEENIGRMETIYADVVTAGDLTLAKKELRLHLREHVVWERNTVWREMIGIERKAQAANMGIRRSSSARTLTRATRASTAASRDSRI
ncbi:hypothetical protein VE04_05453 [Pseudogymnoascus sp. 24MN13]|nr:hypothetical protein VE04_05453 [Pseudogymnoascus sp. 24MN13]